MCCKAYTVSGGFSMSEGIKRKTRTSSAVKRRYNEKTYDRIVLNVKKDTAQAFKDKCNALGIPYSQVLHKAIEDFLNAE